MRRAQSTRSQQLLTRRRAVPAVAKKAWSLLRGETVDSSQAGSAFFGDRADLSVGAGGTFVQDVGESTSRYDAGVVGREPEPSEGKGHDRGTCDGRDGAQADAVGGFSRPRPPREARV